MRKLPFLAFVDNIVLFDEDESKEQHQRGMLHDYLKGLGMTISGEKSQTFQMVAKRDTWFVKEPRIRLENTNIPTVDPGEPFRYLGAKMEPWKGIHCSIIVPEISSVVRRDALSETIPEN